AVAKATLSLGAGEARSAVRDQGEAVGRRRRWIGGARCVVDARRGPGVVAGVADVYGRVAVLIRTALGSRRRPALFGGATDTARRTDARRRARLLRAACGQQEEKRPAPHPFMIAPARRSPAQNEVHDRDRRAPSAAPLSACPRRRCPRRGCRE